MPNMEDTKADPLKPIRYKILTNGELKLYLRHGGYYCLSDIIHNGKGYVVFEFAPRGVQGVREVAIFHTPNNTKYYIDFLATKSKTREAIMFYLVANEAKAVFDMTDPRLAINRQPILDD